LNSWLLKTLGASVLFALSTVGYAQEKLTILWAQWDPANYLQELVKGFEKETGTQVVVETTPWADFQTKAFREWTAHGDAYDMVV
jgi:multiple sugar transport system substrate-binding protein